MALSEFSDVIKTFFQDQDLNFKTKIKTKTLKFFQDQDQDILMMYERPTEKYFSFSAVNENADENKIPFTAENERTTFSAEKNENESHLIMSVFFLLVHSVTKSALQCAANISSNFAFFAGGHC